MRRSSGPGNVRSLRREVHVPGSKAEHKNWADDAMRQPESGAFIRDPGSWILARRPCDHPNCSAFRLSELWVGHRPLQAALSGSLIKAPGFAGGYLLLAEWRSATRSELSIEGLKNEQSESRQGAFHCQNRRHRRSRRPRFFEQLQRLRCRSTLWR